MQGVLERIRLHQGCLHVTPSAAELEAHRQLIEKLRHSSKADQEGKSDEEKETYAKQRKFKADGHDVAALKRKTAWQKLLQHEEQNQERYAKLKLTKEDLDELAEANEQLAKDDQVTAWEKLLQKEKEARAEEHRLQILQIKHDKEGKAKEAMQEKLTAATAAALGFKLHQNRLAFLETGTGIDEFECTETTAALAQELKHAAGTYSDHVEKSVLLAAVDMGLTSDPGIEWTGQDRTGQAIAVQAGQEHESRRAEEKRPEIAPDSWRTSKCHNFPNVLNSMELLNTAIDNLVAHALRAFQDYTRCILGLVQDDPKGVDANMRAMINATKEFKKSLSQNYIMLDDRQLVIDLSSKMMLSMSDAMVALRLLPPTEPDKLCTRIDENSLWELMQFDRTLQSKLVKLERDMLSALSGLENFETQMQTFAQEMSTQIPHSLKLQEALHSMNDDEVAELQWKTFQNVVTSILGFKLSFDTTVFLGLVQPCGKYEDIANYSCPQKACDVARALLPKAKEEEVDKFLEYAAKSFVDFKLGIEEACSTDEALDDSNGEWMRNSLSTWKSNGHPVSEDESRPDAIPIAWLNYIRMIQEIQNSEQKDCSRLQDVFEKTMLARIEQILNTYATTFKMANLQERWTDLKIMSWRQV